MSDLLMYDWIASHARSRPSSPALIDDHSSRVFSYADIDARIGRLARYLRDTLGIRAGNRVATLAHNSTNGFEVQFACLRLGAVFVPLNVRLAVPELLEIVQDCGAAALLYDSEFEQAAGDLQAQCGIKTILMHEKGGAGPYDDAVRNGCMLEECHVNALDDCWTLIYTSGTTGRPKGVMVSYQMVVFHAINYGFATGVTPDSHCLTFLPLFHISGLNLAANPCLMAGGSVTVMRRFDPARALALLPKHTHVFGVPANYLFMQQLAEFEQADISGIRSMGVSGAPMPIPLLDAYARKGVPMQQTFGMSETGPTVTVLSAERAFDKLGSSGLPVVHIDVQVTDAQGEPVPRGEIGELRVRGPSVTRGYWNRPEETRKAFEDGWFRTGDMVRQDADGYFYVVDRSKNMYISGGENVYPAEVERVIEKLDGVREVAVLGQPHDKWGEVGHALVAINAPGALDALEILAHCRQHLAGYKIPHAITFVDHLPRNATGKVDRRALSLLIPEAEAASLT
ncbi:MAG: long-chain fatty acid--CoA ligase [Pusillimonas sp.]